MGFEENVERIYTDDTGKTYHERLNVVPDIAYPWVARLRRNKIQPFVREKDVVLEYGAGTGWNLSELICARRLGFDIAGHIEPFLQKHGIDFVEDTSLIPDGSVNVVICHHVLEHAIRPPDLILEMKRILAGGGSLLLFAPYEIERKYKRFNAMEPNHHLYSWNGQSLGNLVASIGFTGINVSIGRFGYDRFAGVWAAKMHIGETGFHFLRGLLHVIKPAFEVVLTAVRE